mmetsp:Transcript_12801/g.35350  ORF Transcript_12801/g.35350 Transcript_12801/m.35350 type:complete len:211 (+) Transcript_12801:470-1102(+)
MDETQHHLHHERPRIQSRGRSIQRWCQELEHRTTVHGNSSRHAPDSNGMGGLCTTRSRSIPRTVRRNVRLHPCHRAARAAAYADQIHRGVNDDNERQGRLAIRGCLGRFGDLPTAASVWEGPSCWTALLQALCFGLVVLLQVSPQEEVHLLRDPLVAHAACGPSRKALELCLLATAAWSQGDLRFAENDALREEWAAGGLHAVRADTRNQ